MKNYHTYDEIKSQTPAWAQAVELVSAARLPDPAAYPQVLFTGCGSAHYSALAVAALYQELTGRAARAVPAGELLLNPRTVMRDDIPHLLVAISRSGTTTETIRAVEKFKAEKRGQVIVISNYSETLSRLGDLAIVIEAGQEESVAQTRSFASMFVAATALCARTAGRDDLLSAMRDLPTLGERLLLRYEPLARGLGEDLALDRFYFLGSGMRYGLACEANLKMKELSLTHCEPFYFLEFRHGPMAMAGKGAAVVGLLSDANREQEAAVLSEMEALGSTVTDLGEAGAEVAFDSGLPESMRGVLYLPVLQLMAFYRALAKGLDPDRPERLRAVITLDL